MLCNNIHIKTAQPKNSCLSFASKFIRWRRNSKLAAVRLVHDAHHHPPDRIGHPNRMCRSSGSSSISCTEQHPNDVVALVDVDEEDDNNICTAELWLMIVFGQRVVASLQQQQQQITNQYAL